MNLQKIHDNIIQKAIQRKKPEGYTERHHIIPRSMGGTNESNNLVYLTGREHCIIHLLLARIHNNNQMWRALHLMTNTRKMKSRAYAKAREEYIARMSGTNHQYYGKKRPEHSERMRGEKHPNFGKKLSDEEKQKIRELTPVRRKQDHSMFKGTIMATNIKTGIVSFFVGVIELTEAGFQFGNVYSCLSGKRKTHKGHTFLRLLKDAPKK